MEGIDHSLIERISKETEGFSGREIMKMVVAWHDAAFTTPDLLLTPAILDRVLAKFKLQHRLKHTWSRSDALIYEKMLDLDESMTGGQAFNTSAADTNDANELLEQISEQRLGLKNMRGETKDEGDSKKK